MIPSIPVQHVFMSIQYSLSQCQASLYCEISEVKLIELKGEIEKSTNIAGDFNTYIAVLCRINRLSRENISNDKKETSNPINQLD